MMEPQHNDAAAADEAHTSSGGHQITRGASISNVRVEASGDVTIHAHTTSQVVQYPQGASAALTEEHHAAVAAYLRERYQSNLMSPC